MGVGDHVQTIYGNATVLTNKRVRLHGKQDDIRDIIKGMVKGVIRTKQQLEEDAIKQHKEQKLNG